MEQVRLGIIGIGGMGSNHVRSILEGKVPEIKLISGRIGGSGPEKNFPRTWPYTAREKNLLRAEAVMPCWWPLPIIFTRNW